MPKNWKTYKLGEITSRIGDGLHGTPKYVDDGEYYFINGSNLVDGKIVINPNTKRVSVEEYNKYKKELSNDTILLGINGTIGNVALFQNEKCVLGKSAAYINVREELSHEIAHAFPGRTCNPHPKPAKECAQCSVSGRVVNENAPPHD